MLYSVSSSRPHDTGAAHVEGQAYRVRPGDTLSAIAEAHGTTVAEILRANPHIHDADLVYAGDTLHLPVPGGPAPQAVEVYTVRSGDTLSELAARFDTDVSTLARLNGIADPNLIAVGAHLRLPVNGAHQPSTTRPSSAGDGTPPARGLSEADYASAARLLRVDVAAIKAVAWVEASGNGFLPSGKPKILFEAHVFSQKTEHRYDASHPGISSPRWNRALYGAAGEHQWQRFEEAYRLDPQAAMQSASWGRFQIMGFNYRAAGYRDLQSFVAAMKRSEGEQLQAFARFIQANPSMHQALQRHDWAAFARAYNGPGYAQNGYDAKIAAAYRRFTH